MFKFLKDYWPVWIMIGFIVFAMIRYTGVQHGLVHTAAAKNCTTIGMILIEHEGNMYCVEPESLIPASV